MKKFRVYASNSKPTSIMKKFAAAVEEKAEVSYGFIIESKLTGRNITFNAYEDAVTDENLVSSLTIDIEDLEPDELESDRAWFENSVNDIIEDLANDNSGEVKHGPKF